MLAKSKGVPAPGKWILNLLFFFIFSEHPSLSASFFFFYHFSFILLCFSASQPNAYWRIYHPQFTELKLGRELEDTIECVHATAYDMLKVTDTLCIFFVRPSAFSIASMWAAASVSVCICIHLLASVSIWLSVPIFVGLWVSNWAHFNRRGSTGAEKVPWTRRVCLIGHATVPLREFSAQRLMFHCSWGKLIQENITHNSPPTVHNGGGLSWRLQWKLVLHFPSVPLFPIWLSFPCFYFIPPFPNNAMMSSSLCNTRDVRVG